MGLLFKDDLLDQFGTCPLAYIYPIVVPIIKSNTFTLEGRTDRINCSVLLTAAENDRVNTIDDVEAFFGKLQCSKKLIKFHADRGASDHCEMNNRSLVNRKIIDWTDAVI